jgi:C-terminal processing protease CtpA/Prc
MTGPIRLRLGGAASAALLLFACGPSQGTIGAMLVQKQGGELVVDEVPPRLAADKAGILPGDHILLIDGRDVRLLDEAAIYRALTGDTGTEVKLTILRGDEVLRLTLKRTPAPQHPKRHEK